MTRRYIAMFRGVLPFSLRLDEAASELVDDTNALEEALKAIRGLSYRIGKGPSIVARRDLRAVAEQNVRAANAQVRQLNIGRPFSLGELESKLLRDTVAENVTLISSIPERLHAQVERVIVEGIESGSRVETIAKRIEERFHVSESRARLIARTEVNKLNGRLTQMRNEELGIDRYRWITSRDSRVRHDHRVLDGTIQRWDSPPIIDQRTGIRGGPGQIWNCRCVSAPIIDDILSAFDVGLEHPGFNDRAVER